MLIIFLLLWTSCYATKTQEYDSISQEGYINCTLRFFPSIGSGNASINAFQKEPILYDNDSCATKPFQLTRSQTGAEVIECEISCIGTATVGVQAEFNDKSAMRFFQIRCFAEFSLQIETDRDQILVECHSEREKCIVKEILRVVESWNGSNVFGPVDEVQTTQITGWPFKRGDWSTDRRHKWSLSTSYVAYATHDKNVNITIELALRSNLTKKNRGKDYPDFDFICALFVTHETDNNNNMSTWSRTQGLKMLYENEDCELDPVFPADADIENLRKGDTFGRIFCMGPAKIKILANYSKETKVEDFLLECSAKFPVDLDIKKELSFQKLIWFDTVYNRPNKRYRAAIRGSPNVAHHWIVNNEFQQHSLSREYTFYAIWDPAINISIHVGFTSTANKSKVPRVSDSELKIHSRKTDAFISCSHTDAEDPPLFFRLSAGDHPTETRTLAQCLSSDNVDECEFGADHGANVLNDELEVVSTYRHGMAYCRSAEKELTLEYFTPITSFEVVDNISLIWDDENVIHLQEDDGLDVLLLPFPNNSFTAPTFYETEDIGFECHFLDYFLRVPLFWWVVNHDGSKAYLPDEHNATREEKETRDPALSYKATGFVQTSRVKVRSHVGMIAVGCGAYYWNFARNATATYPVIIQSLAKATTPVFLVNESIHFVTSGKGLQLNCSAHRGDPEPRYSWTFHGNDERIGSYPFYNVSTRIEGGRTISSLIIPAFGDNMEGEYVCNAVNLKGNSSRSFKIGLDLESKSWGPWMYVAGSAGLVALLATILVAVTRRFYVQRSQLSGLEINVFENGDKNELKKDKFAHENAQFMPYNRQYEIDWKDFQISYNQKLGEGAYGAVFEGHMTANPSKVIAVKTLKEGADKASLLALLSELKIMIHLDGHENVVKLIGSCTSFLKDGRVYLLTEFCPMGSLDSYLKKVDKKKFGIDENRLGDDGDSQVPEWNYDNVGALNTKDLIGWGIQIARGMQHLENKNVVHGDLAARNILMCSKSQVKITDFGLSRQLLENEIYVKKSEAGLPWRWLALESLKSLEFTHKSDVWGYGVTLWEIFTLGLLPYPGMSWTLEFVSLLEENLRLHRPQFASQNLFSHILDSITDAVEH